VPPVRPKRKSKPICDGLLFEEADSPLAEAVSSEPVSAPLFPANRVKYRELQRLASDQAFELLEKARSFNV
jgi:hypothetical protein